MFPLELLKGGPRRENRHGNFLAAVQTGASGRSATTANLQLGIEIAIAFLARLRLDILG